MGIPYGTSYNNAIISLLYIVPKIDFYFQKYSYSGMKGFIML